MAQSQGIQFTSSLGRVVWGHPGKLVQKTDDDGKPVFKEDGVTPAMQVVFGLAIPKQDFLANEWPKMVEEAAKGYGLNQQGQANVPDKFSWKMKDGDVDKDGKGVPLNTKEGYAGCYILTIASNTGYPVNCFKFNQATGAYDQLTEDQCKAGYWYSVALRLQVNVPSNRSHTPGLYVNPEAVELVGYDKEIVAAGVNPMQAFGGRQHQLPQGVSATPIMQSGAASGVGMPGVGAGQPAQQMPGAGGFHSMNQQQPIPQQPGGMPQYQQPMQQAPQQMPGNAPMQQPAPQQQFQQPGGMPAPATDFVQNAGMPGGMPQYQQPMQQAPQQQFQQQPGGMPGIMPQR